MSIAKHLAGGLVVRLLTLAYGLYQDSTNIVKFTDIDYSVYTDAANYVVQGKSPYNRETYRYTPILAWLLTPNITLWSEYGKVVFILFDLLVAYLIYLIVSKSKSGQGWNLTCSLLWLYNPLPIVICTRGSSESIILAIVLTILYFYHVNAIILAGLFYGFSVHFKPYTILFGLPLYISLRKPTVPLTLWNLVWPNRARTALVIASVLGFVLPTLVCYGMYGKEFLDETYFYHLTRKDIKHNFSLYFYLLYLKSDSGSILLKLSSFLPQLVLLTGVAFLFPLKDHVNFCFFVQTYCFVIFNKVCTSQYFLWYLSLLPIIIPKLQLKLTHSLILLVVWYFAQFSWLLPAYYLEFEGRNTFMYIWLESIAFFCANIGILAQLIKSYSSE